jgi:2-isopropylmalate synthase/UPF0716 protein FxsA
MKYFLLYLFLEIVISVNISSVLGGLLTFIEVVLSALVGIFILMNLKTTISENMSAVSYHKIDLHQFQKLNLFTLFGAVLLIVPGFLTDIMGVIMQFSVLTTMIVNRYAVKSNHHNRYEEQTHIKKDSDVIDVEIINDDSTAK